MHCQCIEELDLNEREYKIKHMSTASSKKCSDMGHGKFHLNKWSYPEKGKKCIPKCHFYFAC